MNIRAAFLLAALIAATPCFAEDTVQPTTAAQASDVTRGYLNNQTFSFTPQLGALTYGTPFNGTQARGVIGIGVDLNFLNALTPPDQRYGAWSHVYIGPQSGFFFAHTGSASAGFVGTGATTTDIYANAGYMWIPVDLKIGYAFSDNFRISVHGGGNVVYQTVSGTVNVGNSTVFSSTTASNSSWNIFPNVGGDVEWGIGRDISILIRPDVTIASGTSPFAGTVGLGIALS